VRSRLPALAVLLLPVALRPFRVLPLAAARPLLLPLRLLALRLLAVPVRLRPLLLAVRSLLLPFRSLLLPVRSLRLPELPRAVRLPEPDRSLAAVRVRAEGRGESSSAAACSWSIRCPAPLVQLCDGTPFALSWRAKLFAAASVGKGPTSSRFGAV
jgi:hypothetical protein